VWLERNDQVHGQKTTELVFQSREEEELHHKARELYERMGDVNYQDRDMFGMPLPEMLARSARTLKTWVRATKTTMKKCQEDFQVALRRGQQSVDQWTIKKARQSSKTNSAKREGTKSETESQDVSQVDEIRMEEGNSDNDDDGTSEQSHDRRVDLGSKARVLQQKALEGFRFSAKKRVTNKGRTGGDTSSRRPTESEKNRATTQPGQNEAKKIPRASQTRLSDVWDAKRIEREGGGGQAKTTRMRKAE
jgi:hypothetical protein